MIPFPRHHHYGDLLPASSSAQLALVLGAGGARGFAHVGALSVVEQHRLPIDLVVGVSMGSVIGAGYAAGIPADDMLVLARSVRFRRLFRPRPARLGLLDPSGVRDVVRRVLGDRRFGDLDRELVVLSASITTGEPVVIRDGLVADAVLASTAIPMVFPPISRGDHHLVDGGMIDGLPVRLARALGAERVIAIDADNHACRVFRAPVIRHVTSAAARVLAHCAHSSRVDRTLVLSRMLAHAVEHTVPILEAPDVLIQPQFGRLTSYHYNRWQHFVELGREAALAILPELLDVGRAATEQAVSHGSTDLDDRPAPAAFPVPSPA